MTTNTKAIEILNQPQVTRIEFQIQNRGAGSRWGTLSRTDNRKHAEMIMANYKAVAHPSYEWRIVERNMTELWVSNGEYRHGAITRGWTDTGKPYLTLDSAIRGARRSNRGIKEGFARYNVVQMQEGNEIVICKL